MSSPVLPPEEPRREAGDLVDSSAAGQSAGHDDVDGIREPVRATPQRIEPDMTAEAPDYEPADPRTGPETTVLPAVSPRPSEDDLPTRTYLAPTPEPEYVPPPEPTGYGPGVTSRPYEEVAAGLGVDRASVIGRQERRYGGIRFGAAFFGWMAAAGVAIFLLALLTATGVAFGLANNTTAADINNSAAAQTGTAKTIGLIGAIALLVVLFVAFYCGGYVAARMARFNGARQGVAVWLWSLLFVVVIAIVAALAGSKYNLLANLNLPRIPIDEGSVTTAGVIAIVAAILVSLGAAVLGGLAGMHYHRKVDRAGLGV